MNSKGVLHARNKGYHLGKKKLIVVGWDLYQDTIRQCMYKGCTTCSL